MRPSTCVSRPHFNHPPKGYQPSTSQHQLVIQSPSSGFRSRASLVQVALEARKPETVPLRLKTVRPHLARRGVASLGG